MDSCKRTKKSLLRLSGESGLLEVKVQDVVVRSLILIVGVTWLVFNHQTAGATQPRHQTIDKKPKNGWHRY
jgi:hypothetical protein